MKLSIVTTLYKSAAYVDPFYLRIRKAAEALTSEYEMLFVNDGSPDESLNAAVAIQQKDSHVVVIDLSRNFGHHRAMMIGLAFAQGEKVFLIDADLEEEPEWLSLFEQTLRENPSADVVYGVQKKRKGLWFERVSGALFYQIFNWMSDIPIPQNLMTVRLMTRRFTESLLRHREREVFLFGLLELTGFKQIPLPLDKHSRGTTSYGLTQKITLFVNALTSFSAKPLVFIFYTGTFISLGAGAYILWLLILKIAYGLPLMGWPSLIVSIWFLGGLTIFFIGVLGVYLSKIFREIKHRPYAVIRETYPASRVDSARQILL